MAASKRGQSAPKERGRRSLLDEETRSRFSQALAWFEKVATSPDGRGWQRVINGLTDLSRDPDVQASPAAAEFVGVMIELSSDAISARSAEEALLPLDDLLPKGARMKRLEAARGAGAVAANKSRARLPMREELESELRTICSKGTTLIAAKERLQRKYGVARRTLNKRLKKQEPR